MDQSTMETTIKREIEKMYLKQADSVNAMMRPEFVECSFEDKALTIAFPVLEWEKNRVGVMHGGIISAAFDIASSLLARFFAAQDFAPTIQLDTVYIRPIAMGEVFEVHVKTSIAGRKLTHLYCEGFVRNTGKLAATAAVSFFNENTTERPGTF